MDTAAAAAPDAPAISTTLLLDVVAATPKTRPKMDTVPSSIPNTIVPADLLSEPISRWRRGASAIVSSPFVILGENYTGQGVPRMKVGFIGGGTRPKPQLD